MKVRHFEELSTEFKLDLLQDFTKKYKIDFEDDDVWEKMFEYLSGCCFGVQDISLILWACTKSKITEYEIMRNLFDYLKTAYV